MIQLIDPALEAYAVASSRAPSALLRELEVYTFEHAEQPEMLTGALEGGLLRVLVQLSGARRILEIGLYTGYSALTMAEALPEDGRIVSCEIAEEVARIAQSFFDRSPVGHKIEIRLAPAWDTLAELPHGSFDLVFLDADKENYPNYYDAIMPLLRTGGLIIADNVLWSGRVLDPQDAADRALASFNQKALDDPRTEVVMLTIRDGVSLIRKC